MKPIDLLRVWLNRAHAVVAAHHQTAAYLQRMHYCLGIPVIVLSTIVGTTVFATLQKHVADDGAGFSVKLAVGLFSIVAAVLSSLQTFLRLEDRAEKHRLAGIKFGALMREI